EGEPRFAMFETMREYARERLNAAGEEAYTRKAHTAYFMVLAEDRGRAARREHVGSHIFDEELGNLRSALDWLVAHGEAEWGLRMVGPLVVYFLAHRLNREMAAWLAGLLALPQLAAESRLRRWGEYWLADINFELEAPLDQPKATVPPGPDSSRPGTAKPCWWPRIASATRSSSRIPTNRCAGPSAPSSWRASWGATACLRAA